MPRLAGLLGEAGLAGRGLRALDRFHDADIAGAAAEIAGQLQADALFIGVRQPRDDVPPRHQHSGGAEAALQAVIFGEGLAQQRHDRIGFEPFQRRDLGAVRRSREGDAGSRGRAVDQDRARAAHAMLAADMRRRQRLMLAQEIREVQARRDLGLHVPAVDGEGECFHGAAACLAARFKATSARLRIYVVLDVSLVEKLQHGRLVETLGNVGPEPAAEQRARVGNDDRRRLDGADHGAKAPARRIVQHPADRMSEFAGLLAELVEAPAGAGRELRNPNRADDLVRLDDGGEGRQHEVGHRDGAVSPRRGDRRVRACERKRRKPVGGRIGMREAAADRAAVAHRAIGDAAGNALQEPAEMIGNAAVFDVGVGDAGADFEMILAVVDRSQFGNRRDIDQQFGLRQTQVQHRPERLPARQNLRKAVRLSEQHGRVGKRGRPLVVECDGLHDARLALAIASRMRRGVIGISQISTPSLCRASLTALAIAAAGPIAPPSPTPFCPNSV